MQKKVLILLMIILKFIMVGDLQIKLEHTLYVNLFQDLFNKISFHFSKNYVFDVDSVEEFGTKNLYKLINNFTQLFQETTNSETGEITKEKTFDEDDMFIVNLSKNRKTIENCDNHKIIEIQNIYLILS